MASDIGKYTPLMNIVALFLDQYQKSISDMDRCWGIGLRAITEMNIDFSGEPKTLRIPKNGNQTVTIPPDCLQWTKIGLLNEKGEVVTIKINNSLTTYNDTNVNRIQSLTPDVNNGVGNLINSPFYANYYYNGTYCNLFGVGGGLVQYGECRVDERNNVIILNPDFKYEAIIFEYISSPEKDEDYKVETCLQEAVISFIAWKLKLGTAQDYYAEATKARRRLSNKKVTLQRINQVLRESNAMKLRA